MDIIVEKTNNNLLLLNFLVGVQSRHWEDKYNDTFDSYNVTSSREAHFLS